MRSKISPFLRKYFLEGQKLDDKHKEALETLPEDAPLTTKILVKHRRLIGNFVQILELKQNVYLRNLDTSHLLWSTLVDAGIQTWLFFLFPWQISSVHHHDLWCCHSRYDQWRRRSCSIPCHDPSAGNRANCGQGLLFDDPILWFVKSGNFWVKLLFFKV